MSPIRPSAWAATLLLVTFLAGGAVGFGAAILLHAHGPGHGRRRGMERALEHMTRDLNLTPSQRDSVRVVFERHWRDMSVLWESQRPRFDSLRAALDSAVVRQLTPEQQVKFREHAAKRRHPGDHGRGGDPGGDDRGPR